jgi:glycosyltransferase involved in cell wall biosynthesis
MNKYPFVYFLRDDKYSYIDLFFEENKDKLDCSVEIISLGEIEKLNNMFNPNFHILITYGDEKIYIEPVMSVIVDRMRCRWIHKNEIIDINNFNSGINYCFIHNVCIKREFSRAKFSVFTTCYKSYEKINRAYNGMKSQIMRDWEWIILDDSPEDEHFIFLRGLAKKDSRIRLYKRDCNSGNIGNVKNEAIALCRGKYVLELDHDDIILPSLLKDACDVFESDDAIGFVYADFANIYENGENFGYQLSDTFGKGYSGYYMQKIGKHWYQVYSTPGINNITASHLACLPNHPRMWRRKTLMELENYCEFLPICDDLEILMKTVCETKIAKIHKIEYLQFMNNDGDNFSLIRNAEINRLGVHCIQPLFYDKYKVHEIMKEKGAYEDEKYINDFSQIWKRKDWVHKKCNITLNPDFDRQICVIGIDNLQGISELYQNPRNDFMVLENTISTFELMTKLDALGFGRMKCFSLPDCTDEELENYFNLICKYTDNTDIISRTGDFLYSQVSTIKYSSRSQVINNFVSGKTSYLEIGVEYGTTFQNVNIENKVGVDPDPQLKDDRIIKKTSDDFFKDNDEMFDIIFIDGMHQSDYVLKDFTNSINCLNEGGIIFIDDVLPLNEREQMRIPINHVYENDILKYREPWTGDVWKVVYYLLKTHNVQFELYEHPNYRGVGKFSFTENIIIPPSNILEILNYDYKKDFDNYLKLIKRA